ncbi:MAG: S46 family peptidase [Planctomycetota bacterium]
MKHTLFALIASLCLACLTPTQSRAEEGMWLFENLPEDRIRRSIGVFPDNAWLERVRKSSLRFGRGGSGAFVAPNGLAISNHHVVRSALVRMSTPERDIMRDGYLATSPDDELPMPDYSVRALWEIEDVTERVKGAGAGMPASDAERARRAEIAAIESEADARTGLECAVVTLYNGARYHLYCSKRWDDVRLVWAPEGRIAHFGGDVDNFRYPRYCLDAAIVRVYEDNEPVTPEHFLPFTEDGVDETSPTFVTGHPGSTRRQLTKDHLAFLRDREWPMQLMYTFRRQVELERFASEEPEHADLIRRDLPGIRNWRKAVDDRLRVHQTLGIQRLKERSEQTLVSRTRNDFALNARLTGAIDSIAGTLDAYESMHRARFLLVRVPGNRSDLLRIAQTLVRRAGELEKPSGERLPGFAEARLDEIERVIMTEATIEPALERHRLETWLGLFAETLGAEDPLVLTAMGPDGAERAARDLVSGTRLADPAFREKLMGMGLEELRAVDDIMLRLAFALEPRTRGLIDAYDDEIVAVHRGAYDAIADTRFELFGDTDYPDATSSLRLSYGRVLSYADATGQVPFTTRASGLWGRWESREGEAPFDLPQRWIEARETFDPSTPVNFVSTHHIIGGNSGSPVIDPRGRFVGVVFDGNEQFASWGEVYSKKQGRGVSVDARFIAAALREVYDAGWLVEELYGRSE